MSQLQQEEGGEPQVQQSTPPDGAAALAQQRAQEQGRRDAEMAANRAVQSPDDEILQSTGAAMPPSRAMGLDPAAGSLSAAAALAVDSGAAAQAQQADAMAQAAEVAARAPAKKKASERQVTADPATGEIQGGALATWTDEDLSNAFRSAQAKEVRTPLALELQRRRAEREKKGRGAATAPASTPTPQQGSIDGTQADQAQPPRAESSQAAGAQGAPVAGSGPAQELTNGTTSSQHDGAQAGAAPGPQAQAPVQTPAQRIDAGRAAWASMPTAERKALAKRVGGVNAALKGSLHGARWENLNAELQLRLADAMQPQGATNDSTAPAVRLADERPAGPAAAAEAGGGQPAGRAPDAQPVGPRGGGAGQPAAGLQSAVPGRSGASEQAAAVAPAAAPAPTAGEQQAQAIAKEGNDARRAQLLAASERWTSMPAAERQAVAAKAKGLNALAKASSHTRAWADLAPKVREKLAAAMPDAASAPAVRNAPALVDELGAGVGTFAEKLKVRIGDAKQKMQQASALSPTLRKANGHDVQALTAEVARLESLRGEARALDEAAVRDEAARGLLQGARQELDVSQLTPAQRSEVVARAAATGNAADASSAILDAVDAAAHEAASSEPNEQPAPIDAQRKAIKEYGLPEETQFKPGKGALGSGKWTASVSGQSSALSSTVDEAAKSLAGFLSMDRARTDAETQRQALAGKVAEKLKRGEKPTDVELRDLFGLAPNHTYVEQAAVGQFLVDHMAVPRNGIRKALGAAAGDRTSDGGAKYPIVYPRKLHEVFGPKQADAAPAPRPPRGVLAKKAKAEEAARADYFTPGNIVKGYGDSHVRVVSYTPANVDGVWSVTVRQVEKQGSGWEDVPGVRERTHATPPSARELKAGPVERTEELPFRRGEADAQGLTDDQMANLLRIMRPEPAAFSDAARVRAVGQVRETVDAIRKGWSNGPAVVVAFDMNDPAVPEAARRADLRQRSGGATGAPEGFYWRGKAYLLASKLNTPADAARVLHHEVLGHHGLRGMFGRDLDDILNQVATMRQAEVAAKIKEYGLPGVTDLSRRHAAEEVLAEMAEKTPQLHFVRRAVAAIRNWLRANVPSFAGLKLTDADIIQAYILPARGFVERGQRAATDRIEPVFSRSDSAAITPDAIIGSTLGSASKHPDYAAAKGGDVAAATRLAVDLVTPEMVAKVAAALGGARPRVLPVAAEEASGRNKIPRAVAEVLAARLGLETATGIVQANRARRTGLDGLDRIFAPVDFAGAVELGDYLLVDDTLTQGGTFAALASHIREGGGNVVGVVALTGKQYSAKIQPSPEILATLRQKHGDLEAQFRAATGYGFDALTESEARYLARFEPAERLRDRIAEEGRRGSERADQGNPRQGDDADDLSFSRSRLSEIKDSALDQLQKTMSHPGKISLWDKTIGTMRHLAERVPAFKPVYDSAQQNIDDVSMLANDAADRAPRLLPRVDTIGDLVGKSRKTPVSAADNKAVAKPLFEGTLLWGRDVDGKAVLVDELAKKYGNLPADDKAQLLLRAGRLDDRMLGAWRGLPLAQYEANVNSRFDSKMLKAGTVWTDAELQTMFGATPNQIALYREARAAIDRSIDMTARADMMRALGDEYAGMRDLVLDAPKLSDALELLTTTLQHDAKAKPELADRLLQLNNLVVDRAATAKDLQDAGYAPLSRFGRYTLDVVDQDGNRQYFGMFETMKDANLAKIQMAQAFPGAVITQGTMSQQSFKLFAGITPETLELFADMVVGKEADATTRKVYDEYLKLTKNNHSALKRLIQRKGIEGYSQDVGRVVANFVYSNARQGAAGLNAGTMDRAINDIPKDQGELKDLAMGLRSYIRDPQEEGQAVRGMLFAQYLGGSLASAFVNMTQPFAVTLPWLSQFGGMRAASGQMTRALNDMRRSWMEKGFSYEPDLAHALQTAEDDGVVSPQEVHQLMAQARGAGGLRSGDGTRAGDARAAAGNAWERTKVAWGQPFALAEQFNRRSTFIAAFRIAKAQGMPDPGAFARKAVLETQFVYSKANKPQWARGAVAGTLFTFKTYSVSYLELMQRMWKQGGPEGKRAVGWALAMLLLMGGAGGVPFAEDLEDLIDGAGQLMGYNISSKQWRKQALAGIVGKELGEFMEQGLSGLPGAPIDVSGRLGMGNLIPGTGLFLTKQSRERDLLEVVGPAGDLVARGFTAGRKVLTGDVAGAALEASPTAVRNLAKGADMTTTGMYRDQKGYKVIDTTLAEAVAKAIGFQPKSVAEVQEANSFMQRSKSFYTQTSSDIKAQWAQAVFEKDEAGLQRVRDRLADWNKNNPEQPIVVKIPDVMKRVREMNKDRTDRIADTSPKALRQQMREMAASVG
ncbi:PLxRFG domain-containing protein [Delftia acidovorans]|uniref:PLxRFG domain-containing protein n=1 Tax=Delftia acidovorans TaxID=80866 RepID=UPI00286F97AF|nr:PLxRFG domain-containing protein [Delftia acidovorans]